MREQLGGNVGNPTALKFRLVGKRLFLRPKGKNLRIKIAGKKLSIRQVLE